MSWLEIVVIIYLTIGVLLFLYLVALNVKEFIQALAKSDDTMPGISIIRFMALFVGCVFGWPSIVLFISDL